MRALSAAWQPLRYHRVQSQLWQSKCRFAVVAAGRGSGKTELALRRLAMCARVNKGRYFYGGPTIQQAKSVAWGRLLELIPPQWVASNGINNSELRITTIFGSEIRVVGMDKPHRVEGVQYNGGVLDEGADLRPGTFAKSIYPALAHHRGWCWRIGVPKRTGIGVREYKQFFDKGLLGDPELKSFTWESADILSEDIIEQAKSMLDEVTFNEQFKATWESSAGGIYHAFSDKFNVRECGYHKHFPICVGSDFNVDPMAWTLGHAYDSHFEVFDKIYLRNTNTPATLTHLYEKYADHNAGWKFYGDAAGRNRSTTAARSDYQIIAGDTRFKDKSILYPKANPARKDRFAAVNGMFKNALGERRLFIDPSCEELIGDISSRAYKEGTTDPDDFADSGHLCDSLDYIIYARYPIGWDHLLGQTPQVSIN